jgi:membrane associated rhomboid family serine protease
MAPGGLTMVIVRRMLRRRAANMSRQGDPYEELSRTLAEEVRERRPFPWMVAALVAANVLVWLLQLRFGEAFTNGLAEVPYELTHNTDLVDVQWVEAGSRLVPITHALGPSPIYLTLFSSMFLHLSWTHLLGNMLYLAVFGAPLEGRTGPWRFLAFYTVCGLVSGVAHVLSDAQSVIPTVGASGAISGILGAYVLTFPLSEVPIFIRLLTLGWFTPRLPAVTVFGFWLLFQWIGYLRSQPGEAGGIAFMAHIGGFLVGLILAAFVIPNATPPPPRRHGWVSR